MPARADIIGLCSTTLPSYAHQGSWWTSPDWMWKHSWTSALYGCPISGAFKFLSELFPSGLKPVLGFESRYFNHGHDTWASPGGTPSCRFSSLCSFRRSKRHDQFLFIFSLFFWEHPHPHKNYLLVWFVESVVRFGAGSGVISPLVL